MTPTIEIEFGGKTRRLVYDFNAQAEVQAATAEFDFDTADLKAACIILWAGLLADTLEVRGGRLRHTKRTLSELQVGEMLGAEIRKDPNFLQHLIAKINEARAAAEGPAPANPPEAAPPSPLTTAGPLAATISDSPTPISGA